MVLYHISRDSRLKVLVPRVPKSAMCPETAGVGHDLDKYTQENETIKRVCFSESVGGCIKARQGCISSFDYYYVYTYDDVGNESVSPSQDDVPDVYATKERWMFKRCPLKCIGKISIGEEHKRTYKWDGKFANDEAYCSVGRRYRWLKKFM